MLFISGKIVHRQRIKYIFAKSIFLVRRWKVLVLLLLLLLLISLFWRVFFISVNVHKLFNYFKCFFGILFGLLELNSKLASQTAYTFQSKYFTIKFYLPSIINSSLYSNKLQNFYNLVIDIIFHVIRVHIILLFFDIFNSCIKHQDFYRFFTARHRFFSLDSLLNRIYCVDIQYDSLTINL